MASRGNPRMDLRRVVNEAYIRLIDEQGMLWQNRATFFAISAWIITPGRSPRS
jgi:hypothetical protein